MQKDILKLFQISISFTIKNEDFQKE
jgi:hypothetical protein